MARVVELTVPAERTDTVLSRLSSVSPLSVRVLRGASVQPPGDVISAEIRNQDLATFMRLADEVGLGADSGVSLTTTEPQSVVSAQDPRTVTRDSSVSSWEEMVDVLGRESTMTSLKMIIFFAAGVITGLGIWSGAVHVVIGAMLIAPAYEPIARLVVGLVTRRRAPLLSGLQDTALAYVLLIVGGFVAGLAVQLFAADPLDGADAYVDTETLLSYWSTFSWSTTVLSAVAGVVGGLLIVLNRTVLTAGVVIVLVLVPASAIVGLAASAGDFDLAAAALARWAMDVGLVVATCAIVFAVKRHTDGRSISGGGRTGAA